MLEEATGYLATAIATDLNPALSCAAKIAAGDGDPLYPAKLATARFLSAAS
jgi:hypothetical protein